MINNLDGGKTQNNVMIIILKVQVMLYNNVACCVWGVGFNTFLISERLRAVPIMIDDLNIVKKMTTI